MKVKQIPWSEERKPEGSPSRYDHVVGSTNLGQFWIEWKSWKDSPSYSVELDGEWIGAGDSLDEAKAIAQARFEQIVLGCLEAEE